MSEKVTAKQVLAALRVHYRSEALVREVVLRDPVEAAIRRRRMLDVSSASDWYAKHYAKTNEEIADAVPGGWSPVVSKAERRIDALLFEKERRTAFEIKVTRADFRNDTDEKRRAWRDHTHRFFYVAPAGLLTVEMMPDGCGLMEFHADRATRFQSGLVITKRAKINKEPIPLPDHVIRAMFFRVSNRERAEETKAAA